MKVTEIDPFLKEYDNLPIIDVRSPSEFANGHIPGAVNIPLFDDEERAIVGTLYKNEGRYPAIKKGLEIVGPKMHRLIEEVEKLTSEELRIYCWRGGMRSSSVAWLFETAGYKTYVLNGGYKSFRNRMLNFYLEDLFIVLVGGETGSGKTDILVALSEAGEQVIDLENFANHRGSAFGGLGQVKQPTSEHFQNLVFSEFFKMDTTRIIWLEDESSNIGQVGLTESLWSKMRTCPILLLDTPFDERVNRLVRDYSDIDKSLLEFAINKIGRKLGGQNVKLALEFLENDEFDSVARILLKYYDKSYQFLLDRKKENIAGVVKMELENTNKVVNTLLLKSKTLQNSSEYA